MNIEHIIVMVTLVSAWILWGTGTSLWAITWGLGAGAFFFFSANELSRSNGMGYIWLFLGFIFLFNASLHHIMRHHKNAGPYTRDLIPVRPIVLWGVVVAFVLIFCDQKGLF